MKTNFIISVILCIPAALLAILLVIFQTDARVARPREIQKWYLPRIRDTLPLLEKVRTCRCPRLYLPLCGSDNQSYTNVCKMNCHNMRYRQHVQVVHMGLCLDDFVRFDGLDEYG